MGDLDKLLHAEVLPRYSARKLENARRLIHFLYSQPIVDINQATSSIDGTINTASTLITELVSRHLLVDVKGIVFLPFSPIWIYSVTDNG